jgi:DNA repair protein RadD
VSWQLQAHGICAPVVTSKTKQHNRDRIAADFKAGRLRAICNVNVYTEGFNAPNIDCIVLLRPTLSPGLFSQMVGRGLRVYSSKHDCLVLDFARCIDEHGPIDLLGGERTVMAVCGRCRESFSRAVRLCPACGWEVPKQEIKRLEQKEKERRLHGKKASERSILSTAPEICKVNAVFCARHKKEGLPDSLRVQYRCGLRMFREWICLDHDGYAGQKAREWWKKRFGFGKGGLVTVNMALEYLFLSQELCEWTKTITVRKNGKYWEIVDYNQPLAEELTQCA